MQEKEQKKSPLKQRILHYVDYLGISKREFYAKTGISRGTLDNNTGLTEETMVKFIATYQNVNPNWVITGKGGMLIDSGSTNSLEGVSDCALCKEKDNRIRDLTRQLEVFYRVIEKLTEKETGRGVEDGQKRKAG